MDAELYEDERALTAYVWRHYFHLMTALEKRVGVYLEPIVSDSRFEKGRRIHELLEKRDGNVPDSEVWDAINEGLRVFRTKAMHRLLRECGKEVIVNRCPSCQRLVRTPIAQQCTWCGHTWRA